MVAATAKLFIGVTPVCAKPVGLASDELLVADGGASPQRRLRGDADLLREMPEMSVHEAPAAGSTALRAPADYWAKHRKGFIIATIAAPVMALLGALGTDAISFWPRLLYWFVLMETGALIGLGVTTAVDIWGRLKGHPWLEGSLVSIGIALPLTLAVIGMSAVFFNMRPPTLLGFVLMFGIVAAVSAVITAINYAVAPRPVAAAVAANSAPAAASAAPPRLLDRLPPPHRAGPVLALAAEDHYLRVHTPAGSTLILMRLSDAIAELDGADGAQTHRSWWVARDAVARIDRGEGRAMLHLSDDLAVPVSRTHYRNLREAGWF
jgi:DNA-binding LytR/AlgR family response regulator